MRYQQVAMALAMQGLLPGAEAGIMFKRTVPLFGGLQGPAGPGAAGPGAGVPQPVGPGPVGPGPIRGPGAVPPPAVVRPPPPAEDTLTPPAPPAARETTAVENPVDQGPIFITLSSTDLPIGATIDTTIETATPSAETLVETPIETPVETPVETPKAVQPPVDVVETPVETPELVQTPAESIVETPLATPDLVQTPPAETPIVTPDLIQTPPAETPLATPDIVSPPPAETPLETPSALTETEQLAEVTREVTVTVTQDDGQIETVTQTLAGETITGDEVTVTITKDNGVIETVTQTLPAATVTAVIAQPIIIIVEQTTNFNFDSSLGGVCPPVVADPAGSGGFIVGDKLMLPTLPQACRAACQSQFQQCSAKAGENFQVADCEKQLNACNGAAATETLIEAPPQTVTKTVFLPPTEVPGVEAELSSDGCVIITTETLPPDEVATIGDGGISVITTTIVEAEATTQKGAVETTMVVTLDAPPAGGVGAPQPSVVTMTMTMPAAHPPARGPPRGPAEHRIVTVTVGGATGVVTLPAPPMRTEHAAEPGMGRPGNGGPGNANAPPPPPPAGTHILPPPPPAAGGNAPPPPPAGTHVPPPPPPPAGTHVPLAPGGVAQCPPCAGGVASQCPEAVTVTVTQEAVTVTVTKDGKNNAIETSTPVQSLTDIASPPPVATPVATPPALDTPPAIDTPLLPPPTGTTLTTKIGAGPTGAPIEIPSQLAVDDEQPARQAPGRGILGGIFGH